MPDIKLHKKLKHLDFSNALQSRVIDVKILKEIDKFIKKI
jgi:hypothetical protein